MGKVANVATAGLAGATSGVGGFLSDPTGSGAAASAARDAARIQADYQREALEYLKQQEALPSAFREAALTQAGSQLGLTLDEEGNVITDPNYDPVLAAQNSPIYQAQLDQGEQAILRNASATGGLRSGSTIGDLTSFNQNALLNAIQQQDQYRNQLLGLPSYASQIAQGTAGVGQTIAQGNLAAAQANLQGRNQILGLVAQGGRALSGGI